MAKKKTGTSNSITGILGLFFSLFFGLYMLYQQHSEDYGVDGILADFLSTFTDASIVYSYFSWTIFLTIYGTLNLYENTHETGPVKDDRVLVRNFGYTLWWWGVAAVFYQQVALTIESQSVSIILPIIQNAYYKFLVPIALFIGAWGLHHVISGRVFIDGYWDPDIHSYNNHKVTDKGIYSKVRHPIYGGQFLFTFSIFLMWNNWFLAILPIATLIANIKRANTEERELDEILNGEYKKYKQLTPDYMFCAPTWKNFVGDTDSNG